MCGALPDWTRSPAFTPVLRVFLELRAIPVIKNAQISKSCVEGNCSHAPAARRRKLTSRKDYTFAPLPRRITDFVRRARSQIKFSRDAGRRTIIKSKFAKNRRAVEKHLTNRNGVCRGTLCEKKRPRGPGQKSSRQARTLRPRAHAARYENLHFYVTKAALSLLVEIAGSSSPATLGSAASPPFFAGRTKNSHGHFKFIRRFWTWLGQHKAGMT